MNRPSALPAGEYRALVTVEEAAKIWSMGRTKMYAMVLAKEIPSVKIGRARRIPIKALYELLEQY
jgi:excisionase family DNA binding protein